VAATRVITLPPRVAGNAAPGYCEAARLAGAEALELRSDLHAAGQIDADRLASILPLLASERGAAIPADWLQVARWVDRPLGSRPGNGLASIASHHAPQPLTTAAAVGLWKAAALSAGQSIKHVEPLGDPLTGDRLLETQRLLKVAFPQRHVTVLATGALALPFRCLLAMRNALDYSSHGDFAAAEGQRLLEDAVRALRAPPPNRPRRGILGSGIAHSRSPRVHRQPFDRIDLPASAEIGPLLSALVPHYDGFAVTSPFKKAVAAAIRSPEPAVNTLVRSAAGSWLGFNTDVAGARAALRRLGPGTVQVLGDGGATAALRTADRDLAILRREAFSRELLSGLALWTWPAHVAPPAGLAFRDCRVGVIAYGEPGRQIAAMVRARGGTPVALGPAWFVAQAREQQKLWETA
jgi:hypothetical protein